MNKSIMASVAATLAILLSACDDTTDTLGNSLTDNSADRFELITDTFNVSTRSVVASKVLSRSPYSYIGHIKDPETGSYVSASYTTQFSIVENFQGQPLFPQEDSIRSLSERDNKVKADSCVLRIYLNNSVGDSLNPMRLTVYEMGRPVEEGRQYYTDFDPVKEGLLRNDGKAIRRNKVYTPLDLNLSDSVRQLVIDKTNMQSISIRLDSAYTDRDGVEYDNYGTYVMRKYYERPEYFENSYNFVHNVCPGFYFKSTDGSGVMSEVYLTELQIYYRYESNDSTYNALTYLSGTEEVMQTTTLDTDPATTRALADSTTCTYMKTPAGIFTEVELPVEDIKHEHPNDTISAARIVFQRINNEETDSPFGEPTQVLMIPKDSVQHFFENKDLPDSKTSYIATYSSAFNTYTFNNISGLISEMYNAKMSGSASADWNKVLLIPVTVTSSSNSSTGSSTITNVSNEMALKSTRLVGGPQNHRRPINIYVFYNKSAKNK